MIELNKKNIKKILLIITFAIVLFWSLQNLNMVGGIITTIFRLLMPFIIGIVIAFILNVPMSFLEEKVFISKKKIKKKPRKVTGKRILSITLSILIFIVVLCFVLFLVVPELFTAVQIMAKNVPDLAGDIQEWLGQMTANYPELSSQIQSVHINWEEVSMQMWKFAQNGISSVLQSSIDFVMGTITTITNLTIGVIFAVYLLVQKEVLLGQARKVIKAYMPEAKAEYMMHICKVSNKTFRNFVGGQLTEACILGFLCFIGMLLLQIPYAAAISVLVGVTALVPLVGAFIGTGVGVILIIISSPIKALIFVIFILILQQIEGNLIYPKVVGKSVGLPAIWVIVAMTIGGTLSGLLGIIISVPICSILYVLFREDINRRIEKREAERIE